MRVINKKVFFYGSSCIFSNWHNCSFIINNIKYNCSEQAMMHLKAKMFRDERTANKILQTRNPRLQKQLGREVKNFNEQHWINNREELMYLILLEKFRQNEKLKNEILKYYGYEFVEASINDRIWGVGLSEDNDLILDKSNWKGLNLLGNSLIKVCNTLYNEQNIK